MFIQATLTIEACLSSLRAQRSNPGAQKKELDRFVGFASSRRRFHPVRVGLRPVPNSQ
jgi:hypothetical protein